MKYDEFTAQVQQRARLNSREEAERATQATLQTLGERITATEASDLASQLPPEMAQYLEKSPDETGQSFALDEFFWRVSQREGVDLNESTYHARVVTALIGETVTMGEVQNVQAQLPPDFAKLFDVQNEGVLPDVPEMPESLS